MVGLKRFFVCAVSLLIAYILQLALLPLVPHLIAVPNLILVVTVAAGFLYGKVPGLWTGTAGGLILDLLGNGIPGFYTLILALIGYINGMLSEKIESEMILILFFLFAVNEAAFHAYVFVFAFLIRKSFQLSIYIRQVVCPELMLSLIAFMIIYGIMVYLSKRWDLRVNKGEIRIV